MSELEEKLGSILGNPQMMQQIMSLAQAMNSTTEEPAKPETAAPAFPLPDPGMMQKIAGLAQGTGVDQNQQALLHALGPYVSRDRVSKLEKAMRAAKMATFASAVLGGR